MIVVVFIISYLKLDSLSYSPKMSYEQGSHLRNPYVPVQILGKRLGPDLPTVQEQGNHIVPDTQSQLRPLVGERRHHKFRNRYRLARMIDVREDQRYNHLLKRDACDVDAEDDGLVIGVRDPEDSSAASPIWPENHQDGEVREVRGEVRREDDVCMATSVGITIEIECR